MAKKYLGIVLTTRRYDMYRFVVYQYAPYESFSLCGVTDEMDLFQYITLLKALINDRHEGIVTQTGKKEKEQ